MTKQLQYETNIAREKIIEYNKKIAELRTDLISLGSDTLILVHDLDERSKEAKRLEEGNR